MIDAYTIGVTLALEDGVSDGLINIRRELGILDRAIAQSTAGLNALYRLGQRLGAITEAPPGAPPAVPAGGIQKEAIGGPVAPDHPAQTSGIRPPATAPAVFAPPPAHTTRPTPDTIATLAAPLAKLVDKAQPVTRTQADQQLPPEASTIKESRAQPNAAPPILPITLQQFAPKLSQEPRSLETPPAEVGIPPVAPHVEGVEVPRSVTAPAPPISTQNDDATPVLHAAPSPSPGVRITTHNAIEPPATRPSTPRVAAAPEHLTETPSRLTRVAAAIPSAWHARPKVSEQPDLPGTGGASTVSGHISGDIMIDGARLGRWIGEILTSVLNRPAAGMTGVDPRAMPTWPTMQGR